MKKLIFLFVVLFILIEATLVRAAEPTENIANSAYGNGILIHTSTNNKNHHPDLFWLTASWNTQENRWLVVYNSDNIEDGANFIQGTVLYCAVISSTLDAPIGTKSWHWTDSPLRLPFRESISLSGTGFVYATVSTSGCVANDLGSTSVWITVGLGLH